MGSAGLDAASGVARPAPGAGDCGQGVAARGDAIPQAMAPGGVAASGPAAAKAARVGSGSAARAGAGHRTASSLGVTARAQPTSPARVLSIAGEGPASSEPNPPVGEGGTGESLAHWPVADRPRERILRLGALALSDAELLALVLRTGRAGENVLHLARRVLALAGRDGLPALVSFAAEDLSALSGMGEAKAAALLAALELGRRAGRRTSTPTLINSAEAAAAEMADMAGLDREQFRVLLLNTKHFLLAAEVIGLGGLDHVAVHPREVFKPAIRKSAAAVILGHNHPSGDPEPSRADVLLTERLVASGRLLGVTVLDHVVVTRRGFTSLRSAGLAAFDE